MENSVLIAGFGGQGVLFTGRVLAEAGLLLGHEVTWYPSYGPEQRGGTCNCSVVIGDEPIGSPVIDAPDYLLVLNQPSWARFAPTAKANGRIIYNENIVKPDAGPIAAGKVPIKATRLAGKAGDERVANMVLLGALLRSLESITMAAAKEALRDLISPKYADLLEIDLDCLDLGYAKAAV
ncbi:MAG: 2-oxoacid:ferredoxin oxidoreductase subunit gamma [Firmicutes bacterium]|nr:2-oxoacid:ferredoxin oxidoreductase subunit gamma [Bacillota bacterium]